MKQSTVIAKGSLILLAALLLTPLTHGQAPTPLLELTADGSLSNSGSLGGTFSLVGSTTNGEGLNGSSAGIDTSYLSDHAVSNGGGVEYPSSTSLDGLTSFTVVLWARPDGAVADNQTNLAARSGAFDFTFNNPGDRLKLTVDNSSRSDSSGNDFVYSTQDSGLQISEGWVFYVGQWRASDGKVQFYYAREGDASLTALSTGSSMTLSKSSTDSTTTKVIFGNNNSRTLSYDGWMDNMRLYGVTSGDSGFLSQSDLEDLFMAGINSSGIVYPSDAGLIDVTQPPYNAAGDGTTDDTAAFQAAILAVANQSGNNATQRLYVPNGTYRITDTLAAIDTNLTGWQELPRLSIIGQSEEHVILKLDDSATGFNNSLNPKAVLYFGSDSVGNGSFGNYLRNITIDTGTGNSGAIGVDFVTSNYGAVTDVTIQSGDGSGYAGINASRNYQGPGLLKNITVDGFDTGILFDNANYQMTAEHITLTGQNNQGIFVGGLILALRGLVSDNTVPALVLDDASGQSLVAMVEGSLLSGSSSNDAVEIVNGYLYARDLTVSGYANAIDNQGTTVAGPTVSSWSSPDGQYSTHTSPAEHLELAIEEQPVFHEKNLDMWVNVQDFGADPEDTLDDWAAIQDAIDYAEANGKTVVYFPISGKTYNKPAYRLHKPITVGGSVKKLEGFLQAIEVHSSTDFDVHTPKSVLTFEQSDHDTVYTEGLWIANRTRFYHHLVEHAGTQNLAVQSGHLGQFLNNPGVGNLYLEDVLTANMLLLYPQKVWARQLNPEDFYTRKMINNGGDVWVLGLKTERIATIAETYSDGRSEFLGQYTLGQWDASDDIPIFYTEDAALSSTFKHSGQGSHSFTMIAVENRAGSIDSIDVTEIPGREQPASILSCYPSGFTPSTDPFVSVLTTVHDITENTAGDGEFTFRRTGSTASSLTVSYSVGGDATSGSDYTALSGSVTFGIGESEKTVSVTGLNDAAVESPETVKVSLAGGTGWNAGWPKAATVTITDDDQPSAGIQTTGMAYWFDAGRSVRRGADDRVRFWQDLSGNGNHMRGWGADLPGNNRHPKWVSDDGDGNVAVYFEKDLLPVFRDDAILYDSSQTGQVKTTKNIYIKFRTGPDVTDRQVIFEHGHFGGSGLTFYIDQGKFYWLAVGTEASTPWGPVYVDAPALPDREYVAELVFDKSSDKLEIYLHRKLASGAKTGGSLGDLVSSYDFSHFGGVKESIQFHDTNVKYGRPDYTFTGHVSAVVEYNSILSSSDRTAVNDYMGAETFYELYLVSTNEKFYYSQGETVQFESAPPVPGQQFDYWTGDTSYLSDPNAISQTFTMPAANISFTANYGALVITDSNLDGLFDVDDDITYTEANKEVINIINGSARGGDMGRLQGTQIGDYITYEINVPANDYYTVHLGSIGSGGVSYAIVKLMINGVAIGGNVDLAAGSGLKDHSFGVAGLAEGKHIVRIEVVGENNSDNRYLVPVDYIDVIYADIDPPSTPGTASSTVQSAVQVDLSWGASTDNAGIDHYNIYRNDIAIGTATGTTYSDATANPGTTYKYAITAEDGDGNLSPSSNEIYLTTPRLDAKDTLSDYQTAVAALSPTYYYKFDAGSLANNGSGSGGSLTDNNTSGGDDAWGNTGDSRKYDATSDYLSTATDLTADAGTIVFLFKTPDSGVSSSAYLFEQGTTTLDSSLNMFAWSTDGGTHIRVADQTGLPDPDERDLGTLLGNTWYFCAIRWDEATDTVDWYIGRAGADALTTDSITIGSTKNVGDDGAFYIGNRDNNASGWVQGTNPGYIDEFAVYDTVLSETNILALYDSFQGSAFGPLVENYGYVAFETEVFDASYYGINGFEDFAWVDFTETGIFNGAGMHSQNTVGNQPGFAGSTTNGPQLDYEIDFLNPGSYRVWVRMYANKSNHDTIHVGLNGNCTTNSEGKGFFADQYDVWKWMSDIDQSALNPVVNPATGVRTFNIWMRDDDVKIDRVILTTNPNLYPTPYMAP